MKKNFVVATTFLLVLAVVVGGVWRKKNEEQRVEQPVVSPTLSTKHVDELGSRTNPIPRLSTRTYEFKDDKYGITMTLPIEFNESFEKNGLVSNQLSLLGYRNKVPMSGENFEYIPNFVFSFALKDKSTLNKTFSKFELEIYPFLKNLKVGQSYTYAPSTLEMKLKTFGGEYLKNRPTVGDTIYMREKSHNDWKVYKYIDDNEGEPSYGYIAIIEKENYFLEVYYFTFYWSDISQNYRDEAINYYKDLFYYMLESTTFSK